MQFPSLLQLLVASYDGITSAHIAPRYFASIASYNGAHMVRPVASFPAQTQRSWNMQLFGDSFYYMYQYRQRGLQQQFPSASQWQKGPSASLRDSKKTEEFMEGNWHQEPLSKPMQQSSFEITSWLMFAAGLWQQKVLRQKSISRSCRQVRVQKGVEPFTKGNAYQSNLPLSILGTSLEQQETG
ncbi:hypothetical protein FGO68_gene15364 [Halteria grandinella]|uniref:Uncharacterized protein n=1 Tax=Halteria grandinella TaxID=5974 RepID=A0A8J8T8Y5_HALGN|nr:hypothetical protein FGO68_gene15364 [Halteria grandinella]